MTFTLFRENDDAADDDGGCGGIARGCVALSGQHGPASADPGKTYADKAIADRMEKVHKGDAAPFTRLTKVVEAAKPDWAQVGKDAKAIGDLAQVLKTKKPYASGRYVGKARSPWRPPPGRKTGRTSPSRSRTCGVPAPWRLRQPAPVSYLVGGRDT